MSKSEGTVAYISETSIKRDDARRWATADECQVERGQTPSPSKSARLRRFSELVDLHIANMREVGRAPGRTKCATLQMLKSRIGQKKLAELDRELVIQFGRDRAKEGAGPAMISMDIGAIRLGLQHASSIHDLSLSSEPFDLARCALCRIGLVGKSNERDRRPTEDKLSKLITHFEGNGHNDRKMLRRYTHLRREILHVLVDRRAAQMMLGSAKRPERTFGSLRKPVIRRGDAVWSASVLRS